VTTLVALGAATATVDRTLTLDLDFAVVFVRVMVVVVAVVFVVGSPDRQGYRNVRRYAVIFPVFPVVARPGRTTVECVQAALTPQQARPRRRGIRVRLLTWPVRSQSHLRELTRINLPKELLVGSASRAAFVESVLEDALTFTLVGMTRRTTAVGPVLHSDARGRAALWFNIAILFLVSASWRLGRATGKVVEAVSVPALGSRRMVTVGQVVGRLAVAVAKARHDWWSLGGMSVSVKCWAVVVGGGVRYGETGSAAVFAST
jgi:hypothetical protein